MNDNTDKKIISINPNLFNIKANKKTKKTTSINPISPSTNPTNGTLKANKPLLTPILRQKILLKRLNDNRISNNKVNDKSSSTSNLPTSSTQNTSQEGGGGGDNFNDSVSYLETLAAKNTLNKEKQAYEKLKIKKRDEAYRKTLHNPYRLKEHIDSDNNTPPLIEIDLPTSDSNTNPISIKNIYSNASIPSYKIDNDVPYGVLKAGIKPTYKSWKKTQKNTSNNSLFVNSIDDDITDMNTDKLEYLRNTIKKKQLEYKNLVPSILSTDFNNHSMSINNNNNDNINNNNNNKFEHDEINNSSDSHNSLLLNEYENHNNNHHNHNPLPFIPETNSVDKLDSDENNIQKSLQKKLLKKTIKKKFLLGRNDKKKVVSVLIKNNQTKKNIINATRSLRSQPISEIKKYLKAHNLIKSGDNAPNDVLRTLYENSILAGDITNTNVKTLLYNFKTDD